MLARVWLGGGARVAPADVDDSGPRSNEQGVAAACSTKVDLLAAAEGDEDDSENEQENGAEEALELLDW